MRKRKVLICIYLFIITFLNVGCAPDWQGDRPSVSIDYYRVNWYAENEKYWANIVGNEGSEIMIRDKRTGMNWKISVDFLPSQIAFGKSNFYLLECGDNRTTTDAKIYRYDYSGKFIEVREVNGCNYIAVKDGKIFFQHWLNEEQRYPDILYKGIIADYWLDENHFQGEMMEIVADENGECMVGNLTFYRNTKGYFSTEREYEGYPSLGSYTVSQIDHGYVTKQMEEKIRILKKQANLKKNQLYYTCFYQKGAALYGVFNVWIKAGYNAHDELQIPINKCVHSYAYRIDLESEKIEVIHKLGENCVGLITTKDSVVYCEKEEIKKTDLTTGGIKILFNSTQEKSVGLEDIGLILQPPYLLIRIYPEGVSAFNELYKKYE